MGRRVAICLVCVLCVFTVLFDSPVGYAADIKQPFIAEQAFSKAPKVKVYITGSQVDKSMTVTGKINDLSFDQDGEIVRFDKSNDGVNYIVLFDNSGSVDKGQFDQAKKSLQEFRQSLKENDSFTLYTVGTTKALGEKTDVLGRTASGSENDKIKDDLKKIKKIKYLNSKGSRTVLYRSINEVLAEQTTPSMRTVMILITDGEDDSEGKDIDKKSTAKEVGDAMIPVYGILLHNTSLSPNKKKIAYTTNNILNEKNCRGYYAD